MKSFLNSSAPILVASLMIGLAASRLRPAECQAVDVRAALGDKQDVAVAANVGGGQSRTIYSQKHLSPHRMMHFGKRPLLQAPPSLLVRPGLQAPDPELLTYEPLGQLSDDTYQSASAAGRAAQQQASGKQLIEFVASLLELNKQQQLRECVARVQQQQQQQPSMKLVEVANEESQSSGDEAADAQPASGPQEKRAGSMEMAPGQQLEQAPDAATFSVASRSVPQVGLPSLTRAHLSSILYGRRLGEQPGNLLNLGSYIKKAEPQRMTFMHFG